jgi:hypothetical protein
MLMDIVYTIMTVWGIAALITGIVDEIEDRRR